LLNFDFSDPNWIATLVAIIVAICGAAYKISPSVFKRTIRRHHNFKTRLLDHFPPSHQILEGLRSFPLGETDLYLQIFGSFRFRVHKVGIRFLDKGLKNVSRDVIEIVSMQYWDDRFIDQLVAMPDSEGGLGGALPEIRTLRPKEALYLMIRLKVEKPCVGILSFRAIDDTGLESYSRNMMIAVGLAYEEAINGRSVMN
jgi:hypothetical protein